MAITMYERNKKTGAVKEVLKNSDNAPITFSTLEEGRAKVKSWGHDSHFEFFVAESIQDPKKEYLFPNDKKICNECLEPFHTLDKVEGKPHIEFMEHVKKGDTIIISRLYLCSVKCLETFTIKYIQIKRSL